MSDHLFDKDDLEQMKAHGISLEETQRQLSLFKRARPYLKLSAPCVPGNGIAVFDAQEQASLEALFEKERKNRSLVKFVPASGAATRMFKVLLGYLNGPGEIDRKRISRDALSGREPAKQMLQFINNINHFAFFRELSSVMAGNGLSIAALQEKGDFRDILRWLLRDEGMGYANLPKGLLLFHAYPDGNRTAFEEHLVEAVSYACDAKSRCALYFTVSPEHLPHFRDCLKGIAQGLEEAYGVIYEVDFSLQKRSTDTLAVDLENRPFRLASGRLLFRPGGHGALLENLNDLRGDIVFIKNIDNVVPDHLKGETRTWKRIAGGYLISIQHRIASFMKDLSGNNGTPNHNKQGVMAAARTFLREDLLVEIPSFLKNASHETEKEWIMAQLNRPVRVCGMVKNTGEPGGGPFWVQDASGERSRQIVETAQIDPDDAGQQAILGDATHFNPVDLVCGVRDWQGQPFDLRKFVDPETVFISTKSKEGRELKALEHPGLWNGSMARWITLFVQVPAITFNPVKTVNDLLRKAHQPSGSPIAS